MLLKQWLQGVGFRGNPFAAKQAEEEGERLSEYFVSHPSFTRIFDPERPRSSLLHAPRGAGKSSTRRMFEHLCRGDAERLHPLIVTISDWMPVVRLVDVAAGVVPPDYHYAELVRQVLLAVARDSYPWMRRPAPRAAAHLASLAALYGEYLGPDERDALAARGVPVAETLPPPPETAPLRRRLQSLMDSLQDLGYGCCYVLIDGIDELLETAADDVAGANLIEGLVANPQLIEVQQLAFKFCIPSGIFAELQRRGRVRGDRVTVHKQEWTDAQLVELLTRRLEAFSDGAVRSLAQVCDPTEIADLDVDHMLARVASGSPRDLLNLGEALFQRAATDSGLTALLIQRDHIDDTLGANGPHDHGTRTAAATKGGRGAVPPLRLLDSGEIYFGDELFPEWQRLTRLQRRLVTYLYSQNERLCSKEELIAHIWAGREKPVDDDSLRRLVDRVIALLDNPDEPRYFDKVPGFLRLINTAR